jgi:hypothetical protein
MALRRAIIAAGNMAFVALGTVSQAGSQDAAGAKPSRVSRGQT